MLLLRIFFPVEHRDLSYFNISKFYNNNSFNGWPYGPICTMCKFLWKSCTPKNGPTQILYSHFYADDSQVALTFSPDILVDQINAFDQIESCADSVRQWMFQNKLKLNDHKTVFMVLGNKPQTKKLVFDSVVIGDSYIESSAKCVNLGAGFDSNMTMKHYVNLVCKSGYYHLRNISRIKTCLNTQALETVIHAFISSRLDYCNALLAGVSDCVKQKMRYLQNSAARVLTGSRKFEHITPILRDLHWLPVTSRVDFKILLLTYKAPHGKAPLYLSDMLSYKEGRQSRSTPQPLVCP